MQGPEPKQDEEGITQVSSLEHEHGTCDEVSSRGVLAMKCQSLSGSVSHGASGQRLGGTSQYRVSGLGWGKRMSIHGGDRV